MSSFKKSPAMAEFEAMLSAQLEGYRGGFNPGEHVEGTVVSIGSRHVVLDVKAKNEGLVPIADFSDDKGNLSVSVGDAVKVAFVSALGGSFNFTARLAEGVAVDQTLAQAYETGLPVEGRVQSEINGGYEVTVAGRRAFCPYSQISLFRQEGASYTGQSFNFIVQEYSEEGKNIVVSRRAVLEKEREKQRDELRSALEPGMTRQGKVTRLCDFGFFVDLGGVEGLVPMKEVSYRRDVDLSDVVKEGDEVEVLVRELDWERERISLSLRGASQDPFVGTIARNPVGSSLQGKVTHLEPFGAFVEIAEGVEGLVPISALGSGRRIAHPREAVEVGQELYVRVESIDQERRRISLRVIDERVSELSSDNLSIGSVTKGIVESYQDFGVFVRLSETATGLLHVSETEVGKGGNISAKLEHAFPHGSLIEVIIKERSGDRIGLTLPGRWHPDAEDAERMALENLRNQKPPRELGGFGDLLDDIKL